MSFVCQLCHFKYDGTDGNGRHFSGSYGPCEDCGKTASCHNCGCYKTVMKVADLTATQRAERNALRRYQKARAKNV